MVNNIIAAKKSYYSSTNYADTGDFTTSIGEDKGEKNMTNKMLFHGECVARQIDKLPNDLKPIEPQNGYVRIADSEVTGNHHQVLVKDKDIEFYEKDGVLYAKVNEPTIIGCVLKERHDDVVLPVGYWEFKKAQEFDPLQQELRSVAD